MLVVVSTLLELKLHFSRRNIFGHSLAVQWLGVFPGSASGNPTLCDTMDCSHPLSMGILKARILEWVAIPLSRDTPNPGIKLRSPALQADSLPPLSQRKPLRIKIWSLPKLQLTRVISGISFVFCPLQQPAICNFHLLLLPFSPPKCSWTTGPSASQTV